MENQSTQAGTGPDLTLCQCSACCRVRAADRRDAQLMLKAAKLQRAGATPAERVRRAEYVATFGTHGTALRA